VWVVIEPRVPKNANNSLGAAVKDKGKTTVCESPRHLDERPVMLDLAVGESSGVCNHSRTQRRIEID